MIGAYLTGIHARSQELISAIKHGEKVAEVHQADAASLVELQKANGLSHVIDGMLLWNSPVEPIALCFDGIEVPDTNIRRWFNTNTFFHRPTVKSEIIYKRGSIAEHFAHEKLPKVWKAVLPAPYTFASLVEDQHYNGRGALMRDFARAERQMVSELSTLGCAYVQLDDPSLVYHPLKGSVKDELPEIKEAVKLVTASQKGIRFSLHTYFEDVSPVLHDLFDFPVQDIGIDFTETNTEDLHCWDDSKGLAFGIVDARSSMMEEPARLYKSISRAIKWYDIKDAYVCPTTSLKYLPWALANKKVEVLGATMILLQENS